ncbi:MAG: hypothetical protein VYC01_02675 [Nitrospinota bacterium]|nr:hypothetical protein [Nitrospinota bacterium]
MAIPVLNLVVKNESPGTCACAIWARATNPKRKSNIILLNCFIDVSPV